MKMLMILLSSLLVGAAAYADEDSQLEAKTGIPSIDGETEAISVNRETGCKTGLCPNPILNKQATITDQQNARNIVDWIMNNGAGTPPALNNTEGTK